MHEEIPFDSRIAPAKLPFREEKYNVDAQVAGWGQSELDYTSENLIKLKVVTEHANICETVYGYRNLMPHGAMCAHKDHNIVSGLCFVSTFSRVFLHHQHNRSEIIYWSFYLRVTVVED